MCATLRRLYPTEYALFIVSNEEDPTASSNQFCVLQVGLIWYFQTFSNRINYYFNQTKRSNLNVENFAFDLYNFTEFLDCLS